ncbi:NYN domain-containing protein [Jiella sp. MQZ9-1]|uniref:NYN domain-containing protein n=1 Tax=Jiella flava TaxID=2816857 RepID=A0A939FXZ5_9HYPH|nr:NYN domain-containing protein [Jiella flava]MBO0661607.1 NYN domain-containing protein [Jiella flava]MCD2470249.1 NYN domain-containing protein [Jiella flava]
MTASRPLDAARRLAVLIDADNASAKIADGLFEEIATIGEASVRRIYGDFSSSRSKGWTDVLTKHAIIPQQQFAYTIGKNASDITLVIDAMDLLHSGRFDGFCLVSSDSDFTRLASRIREQGVDVYGFGEQKTPESFRQACRRFIYTENLLADRLGVEGEASAKKTRALASLNDAVALFRRVIDQMDTDDEFVNLGSFGKQILNLSPDFDARTYGFKKLSELMRATPAFETRARSGGGIEIRLAPQPQNRATAQKTAPAKPRAKHSATTGKADKADKADKATKSAASKG